MKCILPHSVATFCVYFTNASDDFNHFLHGAFLQVEKGNKDSLTFSIPVLVMHIYFVRIFIVKFNLIGDFGFILQARRAAGVVQKMIKEGKLAGECGVK